MFELMAYVQFFTALFILIVNYGFTKVIPMKYYLLLIYLLSASSVCSLDLMVLHPCFCDLPLFSLGTISY